MKNKFYLLSAFLVLATIVSGVVWAQSAPVYNRPNSSYSSGGPLNLQQILQGNRQAATGSKNNYYGGDYYGGQSYRPYGIDDPSSSGLSVSPDDILKARAERDREARARERENLAALAQYNDELAAFEQSQALQSNQNLTGQQPVGFSPTGNTGAGGRRVYKPEEEERLNKPKRVFNSLQ